MMSTERDKTVQAIMALVGRIVFSAIFIFAGISKIVNFGPTSAEIAQQTLIAHPGLLLILAIIFELGGGALILFGLYTRVGALLLFMFIVPVTFLYHSFWLYDNAAQSIAQFQHFMKNFAMCGATLYMMAFGGGRYSFDHWIRKKD